MSGHCPKCGDYCEEDDSRLCAKCNKRKWQPWEGTCDECGGEVHVYTTTGKPNCAYDGDKARCTDCGLTGSVMVYGDGDELNDTGEDAARIQWNDEPPEKGGV